MAIMLEHLYDALRAANVPEEKARAAAVELANHDNRLAGLETKVTVLMVMVAGLYALGAPSIWLLLRIAAKLGALG